MTQTRPKHRRLSGVIPLTENDGLQICSSGKSLRYQTRNIPQRSSSDYVWIQGDELLLPEGSDSWLSAGAAPADSEIYETDDIMSIYRKVGNNLTAPEV